MPHSHPLISTCRTVEEATPVPAAVAKPRSKPRSKPEHDKSWYIARLRERGHPPGILDQLVGKQGRGDAYNVKFALQHGFELQDCKDQPKKYREAVFAHFRRRDYPKDDLRELRRALVESGNGDETKRRICAYYFNHGIDPPPTVADMWEAGLPSDPFNPAWQWNAYVTMPHPNLWTLQSCA